MPLPEGVDGTRKRSAKTTQELKAGVGGIVAQYGRLDANCHSISRFFRIIVWA